MALKQQFVGDWPAAFGNGTTFRAAFSSGQASSLAATEVQVTGTLPVAGTVRNLRASHPSSLGADDVIVFAVMKNGAATACTVTLNTGTLTATDSTNSIHYDIGDSISLRRVTTGSPSGATYRISLEWEPDTPNVSVYGFGTSGSNLSNNQFTGFFGGGSIWSASSEDEIDVVGVGGIFGGYTINLSAAPGVGHSRTFTIWKNGVAQDGSGGTVDSRITIADTATTGTVNFAVSLSSVSNDRIAVKHTTSGTPAASRCAGIGWFVSSIPNTWNFAGEVPSSINASAFSNPAGGHTAGVGTPESDFELIAPLTTFWLYGFRACVDTAPGSGKSWTHTLRLNGANTAQTITIADANTTAVLAGVASAVQIDSLDTFAIGYTPTSSPAAQDGTRWVFIATAVDPDTVIKGVFVAGVTTTVAGVSPAAAFGLDGNTNTLSEAGKFKVFGNSSVTGYFELAEMTAPSGVANKARLFAEDNGAGKTRLMVQFGSGAAQQIAIEP